MVRSPSGVIRIIERAVGAPPASGAVAKWTPVAAHVVAVELAELVVGDLADEGGASAERGDAGGGVAGRAAGAFDRRRPSAVERSRRAPRR